VTSKAMEPDLQTPLGKASGKAAKEWSHPSNHWLRGFILDNRASLGTLAVFIVMMAVFMIANPTVFTTWYLYSSVLTTLPVALFVVVPLVFVTLRSATALTVSVSVALLLAAVGSVVPLGVVTVAVFVTLPVMAVTVAPTVKVRLPPLGKVGIARPASS